MGIINFLFGNNKNIHKSENKIIKNQEEVKVNPVKDILQKIDYEVIKMDHDVIATVISQSTVILKADVSEPAILLSGFNQILDMYDQLSNYPEEQQGGLRRLLNSSVANFVHTTHMYFLCANGETKKTIERIYTSICKDTARSLVASSSLACHFLASLISVKDGGATKKAVSETLGTPEQNLNNLTESLASQFAQEAELDFEINKMLLRRKDFLRSIELIIEKLERHQKIIGKSLIISEMIRDYTDFIKREGNELIPEKHLPETSEDALFIAWILFAATAVLFLVWWGVAGIVSIFYDVNWLKVLAIPGVIMALPFSYIWGVKILIPTGVFLFNIFSALPEKLKILIKVSKYQKIAELFYDGK